MEMQGLLMRGAFEHAPTEDPHEIEWCERRILQRIHRLTLATARRQVEAVTPQVYMRWLLGWQHLAPQTQLTGEEGVLEALQQLEGFEAPAVEWERTLLPARVAEYDPRWLDQLCLSGAVGWGRVSPHPAWSTSDGPARPRRVDPDQRGADHLLPARDSRLALRTSSRPSGSRRAALDAGALAGRATHPRVAARTRRLLRARPSAPLRPRRAQQTAHALWELATAGLAAADGFDQLRALMDPRRRTATPAAQARRAPHNCRPVVLVQRKRGRADAGSAATQARQTDQALESFARVLLARYGVLFRDLLARESNAPRWRELLGILRRLEARGEVRGGRFVSGFSGEQFALPEAVDSLRASRTQESDDIVQVAGADPMNLAGILIPGERVSAVPHKHLLLHNGLVAGEPSEAPATAEAVPPRTPRRAPSHAPALPVPVQPPAQARLDMSL